MNGGGSSPSFQIANPRSGGETSWHRRLTRDFRRSRSWRLAIGFFSLGIARLLEREKTASGLVLYRPDPFPVVKVGNVVTASNDPWHTWHGTFHSNRRGSGWCVQQV